MQEVEEEEESDEVFTSTETDVFTPSDVV
jgi:hypothetical protein